MCVAVVLETRFAVVLLTPFAVAFLCRLLLCGACGQYQCHTKMTGTNFPEVLVLVCLVCEWCVYSMKDCAVDNDTLSANYLHTMQEVEEQDIAT